MASTRLFVSNVSEKCTNDDIKELFSDCGKVVFCDISSGKGYVEFDQSSEAQEAIDKLDGESFKGTKLKVESARRNSRNSDYPSHRGSDRGDRGSDRGAGGGKSRRASSHDKCLICGDYGHWAKNCSRGDGSDVTSGKCFKCGERGHIAKKCYKLRRHSSSSRSPSEDYRRRRGRRDRSVSRSRSRSSSRKKSSSRSSSSSSSKSGSSSGSKRKSYSHSRSKSRNKKRRR